jgi:hypothetical protein
MRARTGKIARLPGPIRYELNRRLDNGALGHDLVQWLNSLPEVQRVLAERFAGHPITDDNISQWRHGGFQDWLLQEDRRVRLRELDSQYHQLDPAQRALRLTADFEERLALELTEELERVSALKDREERFLQLRRICRDVCQLQDSRTRARNLRLLEAQTARISRPPPTTTHDRVVQILTLPDLPEPNTIRGEG